MTITFPINGWMLEKDIEEIGIQNTCVYLDEESAKWRKGTLVAVEVIPVEKDESKAQYISLKEVGDGHPLVLYIEEDREHIKQPYKVSIKINAKTPISD
jgi:hypothetical protein